MRGGWVCAGGYKTPCVRWRATAATAIGAGPDAVCSPSGERRQGNDGEEKGRRPRILPFPSTRRPFVTAPRFGRTMQPLGGPRNRERTGDDSASRPLTGSVPRISDARRPSRRGVVFGVEVLEPRGCPSRSVARRKKASGARRAFRRILRNGAFWGGRRRATGIPRAITSPDTLIFHPRARMRATVAASIAITPIRRNICGEGRLKRRMRVFARSADSNFAIRWQIEESTRPPPRSAWNSNGRKYVGSKSNGVLHAEIRDREILPADTEATLAFALPFADATWVLPSLSPSLPRIPAIASDQGRRVAGSKKEHEPCSDSRDWNSFARHS